MAEHTPCAELLSRATAPAGQAAATPFVPLLRREIVNAGETHTRDAIKPMPAFGPGKTLDAVRIGVIRDQPLDGVCRNPLRGVP